MVRKPRLVVSENSGQWNIDPQWKMEYEELQNQLDSRYSHRIQ